MAGEQGLSGGVPFQLVGSSRRRPQTLGRPRRRPRACRRRLPLSVRVAGGGVPHHPPPSPSRLCWCRGSAERRARTACTAAWPTSRGSTSTGWSTWTASGRPPRSPWRCLRRRRLGRRWAGCRRRRSSCCWTCYTPVRSARRHRAMRREPRNGGRSAWLAPDS
ncbi:hypothetical protein BU14_2275s0001 [Porphyra umbilicalis]|uniref:Uncharacterized protein n=1 Tax=Porphyra umbilicalis TaxID=2786 RepID=A0A1X6NJI1_PORUM|nr:hypothetical protein BU14_2275s0001 [Porphyra umbilicalis]|eukprot:OSX68765.1 hypothetical protein BU14_2275s0001 [Porphyra umbilicalis]